MKGHTTLWDAIEELRRSVREKYGVEHVHLQYGSEELRRFVREKYGVEHVHLQFGSDPRTITHILRQ